MLEICCGSGHSLKYLADRNAGELWGVDISHIDIRRDFAVAQYDLTVVNRHFEIGFVKITFRHDQRDAMALTPIQKLELNKRVDRIFHAPSNAPARGHQPEIAFVTDVSGDIDAVHSSVRDAVASLKAHDRMFQNMRPRKNEQPVL